jgi:MFS transporter, DHA3 family, macrolide efflux protein
MLALLKEYRSLRRLFASFFQSQVGTGAAYVALLLIAYHRLHSSWAISLVLLGEFAPGIVLSSVFGALADRVSRRRLTITADLLRAACFIALAFVHSFVATVALVLLAGVGTALFRPAISAALPGLVAPEQRSQLVALFYTSVNTGLMLGPALTAAMLLFTTAQVVLIANALTFVASACLLGGMDLGPYTDERAAQEDCEQRKSVWAETYAGVRAITEIPGVGVVMGVGALVVLTGAMFNVLAPLLATGPLHAGGSGYGVLMALYGAGMVAGSWANARVGSDIQDLRRRWLFGIAVSGLAMAAAALAPNLAVALVAFTLIGVAENILVGPEMRLIQELVAKRLLGRVFGLKDVLENIAFVSAFLGAGTLLTIAGVRVVFVSAGLLTLGLAALGAVAFRAAPSGETAGSTSERDAARPPAANSIQRKTSEVEAVR